MLTHTYRWATTQPQTIHHHSHSHEHRLFSILFWWLVHARIPLECEYGKGGAAQVSVSQIYTLTLLKSQHMYRISTHTLASLANECGHKENERNTSRLNYNKCISKRRFHRSQVDLFDNTYAVSLVNVCVLLLLSVCIWDRVYGALNSNRVTSFAYRCLAYRHRRQRTRF